ncbi:multicomponent Na+:H+ antiporter subunit C [Rhodoligotrophos appendicifer]|uniref:Na+/H+ antiporter subunit C n=1 Tax=Rhodoligotrophos appendicifer TaxID=987056 RepID=UPI001186ACCB|nr:Na+/H+ antiporter subunit C [Rhodoligotrophos appendicifer]
MEALLSLTVAALFGVAVYLLLSRSIIRLLLGIVTLGNATNLLIFTAGRITGLAPPLVPAGQEQATEAMANALPQALILTAIVISFSLFAYVLVLSYRAYQELGTDNSDEMRLAEPETGSEPAP